jgi:predicted HicB family RNase H-like nuclease
MTRLTTKMSGRQRLADKMGVPGEKNVPCYVRVPESIYKAWQARAKAEGLSLSELIRRAMEGK